MCYVRILILIGHGLDHEEDNRRLQDLGVKTRRLTEEAAIVDKEGRGSGYIRNRPQKARGAFQRLWKVRAARGIRRRTKIRLFKT